MNNLSLRQKLYGLFCTVLLAFGALSAHQLWQLNATGSELGALYSRDFTDANRVAQLDGLLTRVDINILRMIAIGTPETVRGWKQENEARFEQAGRLLEDLSRHPDPEIAPLLAGLKDSYSKMRSGMEHQVRLIEAGDIQGGGEVNKNEVKDNADATFGGLVALSTQFSKSAQGRFEAQLESIGITRAVAMTALATLTLLSLTAAFFFTRQLTRQLGGEPDEAARIAREIANGNLSVEVAARPGDDSSLMAAMKAMRDNLTHIVNQVRSSSDSIATGSTQIATGTADLSQRTEEQASNLQQTAASMEQLTGTVRTSAETADQANRLATSASAAAAQGGEMVQQVVNTMQEISAASKRIGDIIGVIDGIAFQTNILALNAAVEAARAGEQGRGFAVVASEVRNLAGRSADAAKEIKSLISASVEKVEAGGRQVNDAGTSMNEIVLQVRRVSEMIGELSNATVEQTQGIGHVGNAVQQLDTTTQQNAALVEESAAAAESLRVQAAKLTEVVSTFKLADVGRIRDLASAPSIAHRGPGAQSGARHASVATRRATAAPAVPESSAHEWAAF